MTIRLAAMRMPTHPSDEISLTVPVTSATAVESSVPKPPSNTFTIDLLMPRHIMSLSNVPLEATRAPVMVSRLFDSMKPAALVDKPLKAFSRDTTTGMSAPPIGRTRLAPSTPQISVFATMHGNTMLWPGLAKTMLSTRLLARPAPLMSHLHESTMGLPGMIPCSFPAATALPVKVSAPTDAPTKASRTFKVQSSGPNRFAKPTKTADKPTKE
mmetsp:Transcript_27510/g.72485  ORF Transcript_27510/g.72485 Transcript_27510/m.72485 type:complete len:213 (+) Transcript_27510:2227-2865(+)